MRPTTTFLIPNVHIYFVFNPVNTTTLFWPVVGRINGVLL